MKTVRVHDFFRGDHADVLVIDEAIEVSYGSAEELLKMFPHKSEIPLIMVGAFRVCSIFYRLKTPFEMTDETHEVYRIPGIDGRGGTWEHRYNGPELVARLAHPGECQIGHCENNENTSHPDSKAETWNIVFGNYAVLLPTESIYFQTRSYPMHFILGEDACRRQLEVWEIRDIGKQTDIFGNVTGHVDGLL